MTDFQARAFCWYSGIKRLAPFEIPLYKAILWKRDWRVQQQVMMDLAA